MRESFSNIYITATIGYWKCTIILAPHHTSNKAVFGLQLEFYQRRLLFFSLTGYNDRRCHPTIIQISHRRLFTGNNVNRRYMFGIPRIPLVPPRPLEIMVIYEERYQEYICSCSDFGNENERIFLSFLFFLFFI